MRRSLRKSWDVSIERSEKVLPASDARAIEMLSVFGVNGARLLGAKPMLPSVRQPDLGHDSVVLEVHSWRFVTKRLRKNLTTVVSEELKITYWNLLHDFLAGNWRFNYDAIEGSLQTAPGHQLLWQDRYSCAQQIKFLYCPHGNKEATRQYTALGVRHISSP